jgi:FK506-binding protein 14
VIPPEMGYGDSGAGEDIAPGATLNFDIEVVDIQEPPNVFGDLDLNGDGKLSKEELEAFFKEQGRPVPQGIWDDEDKDKDGAISWDEFSGPKGKAAPSAKEEL